MRSMETGDPERPPLHFGDYPRGAFWSSVGPESPEDNENDYAIEGADLRIMWDEGAGPLWTTEDGLLPDDPEWMKRALGLSDSLVADLLTWLHDMDDAQQHHPPTRHLDETAELLADRLRAEVEPRFKVRYHR